MTVLENGLSLRTTVLENHCPQNCSSRTTTWCLGPLILVSFFNGSGRLVQVFDICSDKLLASIFCTEINSAHTKENQLYINNVLNFLGEAYPGTGESNNNQPMGGSMSEEHSSTSNSPQYQVLLPFKIIYCTLIVYICIVTGIFWLSAMSSQSALTFRSCFNNEFIFYFASFAEDQLPWLTANR